MSVLFTSLKMDMFIVIMSAYIFAKVYQKRNKSESLKRYSLYTLGGLLFSCANLFSGMSDYHIISTGIISSYILNFSYMIFCCFTAYTWYKYVQILLSPEKGHNKVLTWIQVLPLFIYIVLCLTSGWSHWIFYTDNLGNYYRGSLWFLQFFFCYIYILFACFKAVLCLLIKKQNSENSSGIVANSIIVSIASLLQVVYGNNYMAAGMIIGLVFTYFELCANEEMKLETTKMQKAFLESKVQHMEEINQSMRVTAAINADYASIYYVDLMDDTFVLYKSTDQLRKSVSESVIGKTDFSKTIGQYITDFVHEDDQDRLHRLLDIETLKVRLNKESSFFIRYRVKENPNEQENFEMHIVDCGSRREDYQIALGFRCIDAVLEIERQRRQELEILLDQMQEQKILIEETFEKYKQADFDRRTDFLTGLHNRHDMFQMLHDSVSGQGDPIKSMFMMDIDNFKRLNDRYGHSYGDECLRKLGAALSKYGKQNNIVFFRYGGEEMLGIGFSDKKDPKETAYELLELVRTQNIIRDDTPVGKVTVSIGYTINNSRYEKMIDYADQAMYRAKENGKNQAVSYDTMV